MLLEFWDVRDYQATLTVLGRGSLGPHLEVLKDSRTTPGNAQGNAPGINLGWVSARQVLSALYYPSLSSFSPLNESLWPGQHILALNSVTAGFLCNWKSSLRTSFENTAQISFLLTRNQPQT